MKRRRGYPARAAFAMHRVSRRAGVQIMAGKSSMATWEQPAHVDTLRGWVADGKTDKEIASRIGITYMTLSTWRKKSAIIAAAMYKATRRGVVGLPRGIYAIDPADLQARIDAYAAKRTRDGLPLTMPSLLLACGIDDATYSKIMDDHKGAPVIEAVSTDLERIERETSGEDAETVKRMQANAINVQNIEGNRQILQKILKKARKRVESSYLDWAIVKRSAGAIFALKNHFGYADMPASADNSGTIVISWSGNVPFLDTRKGEKNVTTTPD